MTDTPNPADFSVNDMAGKYHVRFRVSGTIEMEITADSLAEAHSKAEELADDEDFGTELTDIDDIDLTSVVKKRPRYRVLRDGKMMQDTQLKTGDVPRQPNEFGF